MEELAEQLVRHQQFASKIVTELFVLPVVAMTDWTCGTMPLKNYVAKLVCN
jgi:hypothetical protein